MVRGAMAVTESLAVSISNLSFWFDHDRTRRVLFEGLNLDVKSEEIFVIIGPSGSGKSTLLKLLAGLLPGPRSSIRFPSGQMRISMTFQKSGLFDSLTCGENLRFAIQECLKVDPSEEQDLIKEVLADVKLSGVEDLRLNQVSGGMQKRVGIARALLLRPQLMFYDDPTAGLDPITSRAISDLIVEAKRKYQMSVVLVTSDLTQAFRLADRIGFLYDKKIQQIGTCDEIKSSSVPVVHQFVRGLLEGPLK
jgi:phospholipid/cholesterol/gamma-HCH transport system ATP-binding protein